MHKLKLHHPNIQFIGIGGDLMAKEGLKSHFPISWLSHMGVSQVLLNLHKILKAFFSIKQKLIEEKIDGFIGVDLPDFNLKIQKRLKKRGIPCIQYVSPAFWAWRPKHIKTIMQSTNLVLSIYPFEKQLYDRYNFPCEYVGYDLADQIPLAVISTQDARSRLGLPLDVPIYGFFPASRQNELRHHMPVICQTIVRLANQDKTAHFVINLLSEKFFKQASLMLQALPNHIQLNIHPIIGQVQDCILASNLAITKSGTISTEIAFHKRPFIAFYRSSLFNFILKTILNIKIRFITIINFLSEREQGLVQEFTQYDATPKKLAENAYQLMNNQALQDEQIQAFSQIHQKMLENKVEIADVVLNFLSHSSSNNPQNKFH